MAGRWPQGTSCTDVFSGIEVSIWWKGLLAVHMLASGGVFFVGICRFSIDPLGMYQGLDESWQLLFLSTIGQASWYSGYVCVALTAGAAVFLLQRQWESAWQQGCTACWALERL